MNTNALNFDLFALAAPKCRADIIAMAAEASAELARINAYLDAIFEKYECLAEA